MELRIEDNDKPDSVPDYFNVVHEYKKIRVGHVSNPRYIVDVRGYDYYIAAGVEKNEMFSKLVMMNMGVKDGCAVDSNTKTVSLNFPDTCRFVRGDVSHQNSGKSTNLRYFVERYNDMFMKMNIGGREYMWVLTIPTAGLRKFKQMVIVFHDINNNPSKERAINKINCFKKLTQTHNIAHLVYDNGDVVITYIRKEDASGAIIDNETVSEDETNDHASNNNIIQKKENTTREAEEKERKKETERVMREEEEQEKERELKRVRREAEEYEKEKERARRDAEEQEKEKERARRDAEEQEKERERTRREAEERENEVERVRREAEEYEKEKEKERAMREAEEYEKEKEKERAMREAEEQQWMREEAEKWKQQHGDSTLAQLSAVETMLQQEEDRRIRQEEEQQERERERIQMEHTRKKEEAIRKKKEEEAKSVNEEP